MEANNVFMFSGQGSQYFHMGAGLLDKNPRLGEFLARLDRDAIEVLGTSLVDALYDPGTRRSDEFIEPRLSNAALLMFQCGLAQMLFDEGVRADAVCGMSLGEIAAAVVADALDFRPALELVVATGAAIERHCQPGRNMAVLENPGMFYETRALYEHVEIAFENPGQHFVVSGTTSQIAQAQTYLREQGIAFQELPTAFGYHSASIDPARHSICRFLDDIRLKSPSIAFYSCVRGGRISTLDRDYFWHTARAPIRFIEAISAIPRDRRYHFIDVGPTGTLANLLHRHRDKLSGGSHVFPLATPYGNGAANLDTLRDALNRHSSPADPPAPAHGLAAAPHSGLTAHVFPGQGSQCAGMGAELFEQYPAMTKRADDILGYSIRDLCVNGGARLSRTQYTQPALFVVNALMYHQRQRRGEPPPSYVAGHSLGEYSALYAAGAFDFATGLQLVQKRGELMAQARDGATAAVIGLSEDEIRRVIALNRLGDIDLASLNAPTQCVLAGPRDAIIAATAHFEEAGCLRYTPLNVSGAFHSRLMERAAGEFALFLAQFRFSPPRVPVVANVSAQLYDSEDIIPMLVAHMTHPVRWTESVAFLRSAGVDEFVEVGPGQVLSRLIAKCPGPPGRPGRHGCAELPPAQMTRNAGKTDFAPQPTTRPSRNGHPS